jgi:DNA repair exonuclease SbcCD ATPase subunit
MQRTVFVATLALLCLLPAADLLHARQAPPADDAKKEALKNLEQLVKQLDELEAKLTEERIQARKDLMAKEEVVRMVERLQQAELQRITADLRRLEDLARDIDARATPDGGGRVKDEVRKKIADLLVEKEKLAGQSLQGKQELMAADEKFRLLERKQENQRRLLNLKIELAEAELFGKGEGADRRKLDRLEKSLDAMRRDLDDIRRKLDGKGDAK